MLSIGEKNLFWIDREGTMTTKTKDVTSPELRKFGIAFFVFLGLIGIVICWRREWSITTPSYVLWLIGTHFLMFGLFIPQLLKPIFHGWMKLARALGWFNTKLILILLYYLMFAPFGIFFRLIRKDILKERIKQGAGGFWVAKEQPERSIARYGKQF